MEKVDKPLSDLLHDVIVSDGEIEQRLQFGKRRRYGHVMYPRLQSSVKKFYPLVANMEYRRSAQEQMLQAEAGRYTTEVEQISADGEERGDWKKLGKMRK